jgi:hypothetical protein
VPVGVAPDCNPSGGRSCWREALSQGFDPRTGHCGAYRPWSWVPAEVGNPTLDHTYIAVPGGRQVRDGSVALPLMRHMADRLNAAAFQRCGSPSGAEERREWIALPGWARWREEAGAWRWSMRRGVICGGSCRAVAPGGSPLPVKQVKVSSSGGRVGS